MDNSTMETIIITLVKALEEEKLMRAYYEEKLKECEKKLEGVKENA